MTVASDLPGGLHFRWYSRNAHSVDLTFPAALGARTFEVRIGEDTITTTVDDDTLSFSVPAITEDTLRQEWSLVETTSDDVTLIGGVIYWSLGYDDSTDTETVTVSVGIIDVTVTAATAISILDGGNA